VDANDLTPHPTGRALRGAVRDIVEDAISRDDTREGDNGLGWGHDSIVGDFATSGTVLGEAGGGGLNGVFVLKEGFVSIERISGLCCCHHGACHNTARAGAATHAGQPLTMNSVVNHQPLSHNTAGAGAAKHADVDSLFDMDEFEDPLARDMIAYRKDFNEKFEQMVKIIHWWYISILVLAVMAAIYGVVGIFIMFLNQDREITEPESVIFAAAFLLFFVIAFVALPFLAVLWYGCHRTFFVPEPHPDDNLVKTPDFENTCLYNSVV
jgi:hypothetical protein